MAVDSIGRDDLRQAVAVLQLSYAYIGLFSRERLPRRIDQERALWHAPLSTLLEAFAARRALQGTMPDPNTLAPILEAFDEPAFVVTRRALVIYQNSAASQLYPRRPEWLAADLLACGAWQGVANVQRLRFDSQELYLVVPRRTEREAQQKRLAAQRDQLAPALQPVALLLGQGLRDKEIAERLARPLSTVRTYVRRIFSHYQVRSRSELLLRLRANP